MAANILNTKIRSTAVALGCLVLFAGCVPKGTMVLSQGGERKATVSIADLDRIQVQVRRLSDSYGARISQACYEMEHQASDPIAKRRARQMRIGQLSAALSTAVGRQPMMNLLDLAGQITLTRKVAEGYDVPTYGEAARPVLDAAIESETEVWAIVSSVITAQQADDLRRAIDGWYDTHPTKRQGAFVRFSEFAEYSIKTRGNKGPSSLLGLLYLDPLASLDPVAAEVRESRELVERTSYMLQRLPLILQYQVDSSTSNVLESDAILSFLRACNEFSESTNRMGKTFASYPEILHSERDAALKQAAELVKIEREGAIQQIDEKLTSQQKAMFDGLQSQQDKLNAGLVKTEQVIDKLRTGIVELRSGVGELREMGKETVSTTESATARLIHQIFKLAIIFVVVIFLAVLILIIAVKRIPRRPAQS